MSETTTIIHVAVILFSVLRLLETSCVDNYTSTASQMYHDLYRVFKM